MKAIKQIKGRGIPLMGNDIDTDRIIPARFLRCVTFEGLGEQVFIDDRSSETGKHPFDLPEYQGANLLVVNENFGCGSSREHAPQAIARWGIQGIIGESFAEIFLGNCLAMGIPCVTTSRETVQKLQQILQTEPQTPLELNLESQTIQGGSLNAPVSLNEGNRQMLIAGTWDTCGQLVSSVEEIKAKAGQLPYMSWAGGL